MIKNSNKKFSLALKDILEKNNVKLRGLASRTNLNFTYFSKLKKRTKHPPIKTIEIIAKGLNIQPEYFLEYRIHKITDFLLQNPEFLENVLSYTETLKERKALKIAESGESFKN